LLLGDEPLLRRRVIDGRNPIGRAIAEANDAFQLSIHFWLSSSHICVAYFVVARFWSRRAGMAVLVAASLFFYGWWNDRYLWILLLPIGCNAGFALALIRGKNKQRFWILLVGLMLDLFLLGYFKNASLLAANLSAVRPRLASRAAARRHKSLHFALNSYHFGLQARPG
jgi:hypothetical protein